MRQFVNLMNVRWLCALFAAALLLSSTTAALAQEEPVDEEPMEVMTQVYIPLVSAALNENEEGFQNFSQEELRQFVEDALAEEITVQEADEIYNRLNATELQFIGELLDERYLEIEEEAKRQLAEDIAFSEDGENRGEVTASYSPTWQ